MNFDEYQKHLIIIKGKEKKEKKIDEKISIKKFSLAQHKIQKSIINNKWWS